MMDKLFEKMACMNLYNYVFSIVDKHNLKVLNGKSGAKLLRQFHTVVDTAACCGIDIAFEMDQGVIKMIHIKPMEPIDFVAVTHHWQNELEAGVDG